MLDFREGCSAESLKNRARVPRGRGFQCLGSKAKGREATVVKLVHDQDEGQINTELPSCRSGFQIDWGEWRSKLSDRPSDVW
jgi:hypothetical protein